MMSNLRSLFILLLLGTASAAMALGIRNDLRRPAEAPTPVEIDAAASGQILELPEMPKYDPPPLERFAAALDRPVFSPDRRPPQGQPIATGIVGDRALTATLRGVLLANSGNIALLTAIGESTPVRVSRGELFLGWRLLEIHPDKVVFERDEETVTLELVYKGQAAPPKPVTPPQRTRPQRTRPQPAQPAQQQPEQQQPAQQQPAQQQPAQQQPAQQQPEQQQPAQQQPAQQQPAIERQ